MEKLDIKAYQKKVITYVEKRLETASREQAKEGNLETVEAKLDKLEQLNSDNSELDLPKLRTELMTEIAQIWLEEAIQSATFNHLKSVETKFKEVEQLIIQEKLDKKQVYDDDLAQNLVGQGREIAERGSIEGTILLYQKAQQLNPNFKIDAESWNALCWDGSIYGYAKDVLDACETAVNNASDEAKTMYQDSRGLARALTGDRDNAIKDFQAFADDKSKDETHRKQREDWIKALKKGDPIDTIFTKEVLEQLKSQ